MAEQVKRDDTETDFFKNHPDIAVLVDKIQKNNPRHPLYDLTSSEQEQWTLDLAQLLLKSKFVDTSSIEKLTESINALHKFEYHCYDNMKSRNDNKNDYGLLYFLGFNLCKSRLNMLLLKEKNIKSHLSVIVPMWGEQNRMQSKDKHKNGEDFIRRKVNQLDWLYNGISNELMDWNLIFVDDGCPHNSGKEAQKLIKENIDSKLQDKISVEFLAQGLETIEKFKNDKTLNNVNDSKKGGAVQMGMYVALNKKYNKPHFIMYTDADLSTNISQSGLLLADITINNQNDQRKVVIGDRYSKGVFSHGYVMGTFKTNEVALKLRAVFRGQLLPPFKTLYDTQCGFKVFTKECIQKVLPVLKEYQGMFDSELLLKCYDVYNDDIDEQKKEEINIEQFIYSTGVVWLHSAEETKFGAFTADTFTNQYGWKHYNQLQQIINIHKNNYADSKLCDKEWVQFIIQLTWKDYFKICQVVFTKGIDVHKWFPQLKDLNSMINDEKYPDKAPKWEENPAKK